MKKYFDVSHLVAFILGGFFWSLVYIVMHFLAIAKLYASGVLVLP